MTFDNDTYTRGSFADLELLDAVGAGIPEPFYRVGISENDPKPVVALGPAPASVQEGNAPWTITIPVTLTGKTSLPAVIEYSVVTDSINESRTLTFAPGETLAHIEVPISGDTRQETDSEARVTLVRGLEDATIDANAWRRTIAILDDEKPAVIASDIVMSENAFNEAVWVTVDPWPRATTAVQWRTVDGTAKAGTDYVAQSGTIRASKLLFMVPVNDEIAEQTETFYVELFDEVDATVPRRLIAVTIYDDSAEPKPIIHIPAPVLEGRAGVRTAVTLSVTLPGSWPTHLSYAVDLLDGTATVGTDVTLRASPVGFEPGRTRTTTGFEIIGDDIGEGYETIRVRLIRTGTGPPVVVAQEIFTIADDDAAQLASLSIDDAAARENDGAITEAVFRVTLEQPLPEEVRVTYATHDGTARAGTDYVLRAGTLSFAPGETWKEVAVRIVGDDTVEAAENFRLVLSEPVRAVLNRTFAEATIVDDDAAIRKRAVRR